MQEEYHFSISDRFFLQELDAPPPFVRFWGPNRSNDMYILIQIYCHKFESEGPSWGVWEANIEP